ncbi:GntR family transcriptional regulator [Streptomyces rochei]|uniref:GntR family transcriptional regulator n=1 Tax=Streptomyces rochei TaxID=1928 RepID=UPI00367B4D5F
MSAAATGDDVEAVRRWVQLTGTDPGTYLPALATIAWQLQRSSAVVRSALEQLAAEGLVSLHDDYRLVQRRHDESG